MPNATVATIVIILLSGLAPLCEVFLAPTRHWIVESCLITFAVCWPNIILLIAALVASSSAKARRRVLIFNAVIAPISPAGFILPYSSVRFLIDHFLEIHFLQGLASLIVLFVLALPARCRQAAEGAACSTPNPSLADEQSEDSSSTDDSQQPAWSAIGGPLRILGMFCCLILALIGLFLVVGGVVGFWRIATKQTFALDREFDLYVATVSTLFGLAIAFFPLKWLVEGIRAFKTRDESLPPGLQETLPPSDV